MPRTSLPTSTANQATSFGGQSRTSSTTRWVPDPFETNYWVRIAGSRVGLIGGTAPEHRVVFLGDDGTTFFEHPMAQSIVVRQFCKYLVDALPDDGVAEALEGL